MFYYFSFFRFLLTASCERKSLRALVLVDSRVRCLLELYAGAGPYGLA